MVIAFDQQAETAFATSWADPPEIDPPEEYLERFTNSDPLTFNDPNPDCNHAWKYGGSDLHDRDFCKRCLLERWNDTAVDAYIYDESTIKTSTDLADRTAQAAFEQREEQGMTINTSGNRVARIAISADVAPVSKSTTERRSSQMIRSRTSQRL